MIRDDLELSVLAEFGDLEIAEAAGAAWQHAFEMICSVLGVPAAAIEEMEREWGRG